jgi:DNA repair exonuclease SbcCD ATPase subunit
VSPEENGVHKQALGSSVGDDPMTNLKSALLVFLCITPQLTKGGQQQAYSPPAPLFPTSMAQCDKFQADRAKFEKEISSQHEACLSSHRTNTSQKIQEPGGTCSVPACQSLHSRLASARSTGSMEVSACRQKVQKLLDDAARKKQEQESAARHAEEDRKEAEDNRKRKEYGDQEERMQAARDAAARKQADIDEAARKKHQELMEAQKKQKDAAAANARSADEARDRKYGLESEKHIAWKARDEKRRAQIEQLEDAAANIDNEQQRHAALQDAMKQIQVIKEQGKQDPEPR